MNVDSLNSKYKVVSKYFTGKTVMDESLTDFQEKKSFKVVKSNKTAAAKPKVKKVKQVKGQKDIRSALKPKKNDLIAYSEDFDSVCRKSGIDVDSEQLQLAIALSKSLQTGESADSSTSCSKPLSTQQRTGLIRTTLKEYGFKVPEKPIINRKTKKRRKPYKLLLTSDEEKQQIITDRYTQRLFEFNNLKKANEPQEIVVNSKLLIYNMSTNVEYEDIKDDSVFYVESLIEETPNSMGCLLKKWSDIPGRPLSPQLNKSELIFSEIECSQEEVDIVLSGSLKYSKGILEKKNLFKDKRKSFNCSIVEKDDDKAVLKLETNTLVQNHLSPDVLTICSDSDESMNNGTESRNTSKVVLDEGKNLIVVTQPSRSLSPDLFDEDDDTISELPCAMSAGIVKPADNVTKEASEFMDLTECVNTVSQRNSNNAKIMEPIVQLSQPIDVTKRKSNDFMEITECVGDPSQPVEKKDEHIDLTGQCEETFPKGEKRTCTDNMEIVHEAGPSPPKLKRIIDLTACGESNEDTNKNTTGDNNVGTTEHIDLTGNCVHNIEPEKHNSISANGIENMDLTQSSNSSTDTLPFVHISGKPITSDKSLEDTIIMNEDDYLGTKSPNAYKNIHDSGSEKLNNSLETEITAEGAILTISAEDMLKANEETPIITIDETGEMSNIDLTQSSDSNEAPNNVISNSSHQINNSSLGKRDNVSVDYDEALENMNSFPYYDEYGDNPELRENDSPINDQEVISYDRPTETDIELKSPCKTDAVENHFDVGGISIIDNLPSFNRKSRNTLSMTNGSMSDSLPIVNVIGKERKPKSPIEEFQDPAIDLKNHQNTVNDERNARPQTPQNKVDRNVNVETPEQSEYIVKTDNVTPMLDYASMSTPERNRELDKYGLKPFKRKRAIQLLTHLYNQTHPFVESTDELTSPSKKRKKDDLSKPSSSSSCAFTTPSTQSQSPRKTSNPPRKQSRSPRKQSRSPGKQLRSPINCAGDSSCSNDSDKENDLFLVTSEVPGIRNLVCDVEDWVFQKREKAKLHSCRVPLHIAFHNYVSCRRRLHEAILRYEPVNIDVIHKELAASGHRYDPKELLKFMDKKCITVKTVDSVKNNKRY